MLETGASAAAGWPARPAADPVDGSAAASAGGVPVATVRARVPVPLRFPDGYATSAMVFSFDGLWDGREHLALGLGDWVRAVERGAAGGRPPGTAAQRMPDRGRLRQPAVRLRTAAA